MQLLKDVAQQARYQAMLPQAVIERQALMAALQFVEGFEDDQQQDVAPVLVGLRTALATSPEQLTPNLAHRGIHPSEIALIAILQRIVMETMAYPPVRPQSGDSFLPAHLVDDAQRALGLYGCRVMQYRDEAVS